MAVYKVPQDVEAEDKLLGPFGFRQFVYMFIAVGLIVGAYFLFMYGGVLSLFGIIPVIPALFLVLISLPLRKEQPMEMWIASLFRYWTKPKTRPWESEGEDTVKIQIEAPKREERRRYRNIENAEASRRLSFLAQIVDTEGRAIKQSGLSDDVLIETETAPDMYDNYSFSLVYEKQQKGDEERKAALTEQLRHTVQQRDAETPGQVISVGNQHVIKPTEAVQPAASQAVVQPDTINVSEQQLIIGRDEDASK